MKSTDLTANSYKNSNIYSIYLHLLKQCWLVARSCIDLFLCCHVKDLHLSWIKLYLDLSKSNFLFVLLYVICHRGESALLCPVTTTTTTTTTTTSTSHSIFNSSTHRAESCRPVSGTARISSTFIWLLSYEWCQSGPVHTWCPAFQQSLSKCD